MDKIKSKQTGQNVLSPSQMIVSATIIFIWVGIFLFIYLIGISGYLLYIFMAIVFGIMVCSWYWAVLDKKRFTKLIASGKFINRVRKKEDRILLFTMPLEKLNKHIPIKKVYDNGLIEYFDPTKKIFKKRIFGVLFTYDPPPVAESQEESFNNAVERIVHSIGNDLEVSVHFYDMIDRTNPLSDAVLTALNSPENSTPQNIHLQGLYEAANKSTEPRTATRYLLAIRLGTFKKSDHALQAHRSIVPGILKSLLEQKIYVMQVIGTNSVSITLREFATMEEVV